MPVLEKLKPARVFHFFEELCAIPHGSGNTKAISDYCVRFARSHGFEHYQDELNNVIIIKPATQGYEAAPAVIVQGHLDMVTEKAPDSPVDFTKDGLKLCVDGEFVYAEGTTLGGDDGIAVAMALALLESKDLPHPRLEAVFTVDEEVGMEGAQALDVSPLQGRRMLNIDSEDEGILTVSCAGGARANISACFALEPCDLQVYTLRVDGLIGGHSGVEINRGRGNANLLMGRILYCLSRELPLRVVSCEGGLKDNAIPLAATATLALARTDAVRAQQIADAFDAALKQEYAASDPGVCVRLNETGAAARAMTVEESARFARFLTLMPDGVAAMSRDIEGLVQTSCNLGVLQLEGGVLHACSAVRSSVATQKQMLLDRITALAETFGGSVTVTGDYPAWEYRRESTLRETMVRVFEAQYGYKPKIEAIHAGLECGLFAGKLDGLDAVSFGPDLIDIHTTRERMSISSVQRTWQYLCQVLKELK